MYIFSIVIWIYLNTEIISAQKSYCGEKIKRKNSCFQYPKLRWTNPGPAELSLSCNEGSVIKILDAHFIRPYWEGDYDYCFGGTWARYNKKKCCELWKDKKWNERRDNCIVSTKEYFPHIFINLKEQCNASFCNVTVNSQRLEEYCIEECDANSYARTWCFARRVEISYFCEEQLTTDITVTDINVTSPPHFQTSSDVELTSIRNNSKQETHREEKTKIGLAVGIAVPLSFLAGAVAMFLVMRVIGNCRDKDQRRHNLTGKSEDMHDSQVLFINKSFDDMKYQVKYDAQPKQSSKDDLSNLNNQVATKDDVLTDNPYYENEIEKPEGVSDMIENTYYGNVNEADCYDGNSEKNYVYTYGHFKMEGRKRFPNE